MGDEYIKREDALNSSKIVYIEYIEVDEEGYEEADANEIPVVFKKDLETIPAADVAPVLRSRWTKDGACSNCGCYIPTDDAHDAIFKDEVHYCYYCGAKMGAQDG